MRRSSLDSAVSLDRYIPRRRGSNIDLSHLKLMSFSGSKTDDNAIQAAPLSADNVGTPTSNRAFMSPDVNSILNISPSVSEGDQLDQSGNLSTPTRKPRRSLPKSPERTLDMPNLRDDFYSSPFDWGNHGKIAVAIVDNIYSWDVENGCIDNMYGTDIWGERQPPLSITAVAWNQNGRHLALGTDAGMTVLWHSETNKVTVLDRHDSCSHKEDCQVDSIVWLKQTLDHVIFSGQSCGCIREIVVSFPSKLRSSTGMPGVYLSSDTVHRASTHRICSLKISQNSRYLVFSGSNGRIGVWNLFGDSVSRELHLSIEAHSATVKALSFCPWQASLLASGGGSGDCTIKGHKVSSGAKVFDIETPAQVCSMVWCEVTRELISSHGDRDHCIRIWAFPHMDLIGILDFHKGRVLCLGISPDGCTLASLGADECLCLWVIAKKQKATPKQRRGSLQLPSPLAGSPLAACIR